MDDESLGIERILLWRITSEVRFNYLTGDGAFDNLAEIPCTCE